MEPGTMATQPGALTVVQPAGGLDIITVALIIAVIVIVAVVGLLVMNRNQSKRFEERFGGTTVLHSGSSLRHRYHRKWAIIRECFAGLRKQLESHSRGN